MEIIAEEPGAPREASTGLSSQAAKVVHQVEQAALSTSSAKDRLDLVTQLTDYVSEALAEGSLTDGDLQRIFQVTRCLGDQLPDSAPSLDAIPHARAVIEQQPVSLHQRTTSDLLDWADDKDIIEAPVTSKDAFVNPGSGTGNRQSSIALLDGLEHIAAKSLNSSLTNEKAAAKALLNAARHNRKKVQQHAVSSKYMNDGNSTLVVPVRIHHSERAGTEAESVTKATFRQKKQAVANTASCTSVYQRLYQLSETWSAHKARMKEDQEEKDARAASPTPPARLSSQARQRAADRLYAHAVQKRARQQAAKESQAQEEKNSRHPSPGSRAFSRHASDFFQRQQDLLARRQYLAEQRRPRDEESLQHCTGQPAISAFAHSLCRSTNDLIAWQARKDEKLQRMRKEQAEHDDTELTLIPRIDRNSRQMALSLASRAAEEAPHMLTVIQSQPQGWVLANRPATARRPALPHTFTTSRSVSCAVSGREQGRLEAPAWVRASGGTSMRLVQTGRDAATCSPLGSSLPAHSPRARSEAASDAAFQHAPWMGHGGVHHMDAGHTEATHKGVKPEPAAVMRSVSPMQMSRVASTGGNAQRHAQSTSATAAARSNPSSLASHRLADTDLGVGADTLLQDAEAPQAGVHSNPAQGVHAVDPIEAFAPAFMLERMEHSAAAGAGLLAKPVGDYSAVQAAQAAVEPAALSVTLGLPGEGAQGDATAAQDSNIQGSAENEWTGFAVDDSLAAEGAEPINHLMTQHILVASSPVGNGSSGQASSEGQDSSIAAYTAAHLESDAQVSTQEDGLTVPGEDQHRQFSRHAAPNSFILGQPSTAAALAADSHHQDVVSASPADFKAAAATAVQISQDKQPAVSRRSAQQSGITSARKALQAMALKAAADAAYRGESSAVSSAPEQPQSALRQTTSSISRQSDALWTPQSTRTSQGDLTGSKVSMHSVLKQKPRPLIPRINLNAKAYDAALQQIPGAGVENIHAATRGYAVRESIRRRTSEDMPESLVKAAQGKSAKLGKVAYAGSGRSVAPGRQDASNKKSAARV